MKKLCAATSAFATNGIDFYIYVAVPRAQVYNYFEELYTGRFFSKICCISGTSQGTIVPPIRKLISARFIHFFLAPKAAAFTLLKLPIQVFDFMNSLLFPFL